MWVYVVAGIVFVASLAGMARIAWRTLPLLSLIDTESLPEERDAKKKKEIIGSRVTRAVAAQVQRVGDATLPAWSRVRKSFRKAYGKVEEMHEELCDAETPDEEREATAEEEVAAADARRAAGELGEAEGHYIAAIRIDPMNSDAYFGVAELSLEAKDWEQAKETYAFLRKLLGKRLAAAAEGEETVERRADLLRALTGLGEALTQLRDYAAAMDTYGAARALEPSNPKYLDLLIEACILCGDKAAAEEAFAAFVEANPDNQKIESLRERISVLRAVRGSAKRHHTPT